MKRCLLFVVFVVFVSTFRELFQSTRLEIRKLEKKFEKDIFQLPTQKKNKKKIKESPLDENICTHFQFASTFNSLVLIHEDRKNNP